MLRPVFPEDDDAFTLNYTPRPSKRSGPDRDTRLIRSGNAMLRLIEEYEVPLTDLAEAAGVDLSVASRRVADARRRRERDPALAHKKLSGADTRYFRERYRNSDDPQIREWLKTLGTRRRKRA